jgi:fucose 4-O-acetylase-like acetyltransferase
MNGERATAPQRHEWVDAARGIGIIAVVIGHVWTRGVAHNITYSFHMPLFFLLSGYLFRPKPPITFARRLLASQGLSYIAFLALVVAMDTLIEGSRGHRGIFHVWPRDLGRLAFGGSDLRGPFTVFWFLPCLVVARIVYNLICARFPDPLGQAWLVIAPLILVVAYGAGWATDVSPLGLLTVPMAVVLLWVGTVWNRIGWRGWMLWALLPVSLAGLFLLPTLNMKAGDYGWPIASIAGAVATCFLILRLGHVRLFASSPILALGRASLVIMYLHVAVIHYLSWMAKPALLVLAVLLPLGVFYLFDHHRVTRRLFLAQ